MSSEGLTIYLIFVVISILLVSFANFTYSHYAHKLKEKRALFSMDTITESSIRHSK